jgi:hypothetical protein
MRVIHNRQSKRRVCSPAMPSRRRWMCMQTVRLTGRPSRTSEKALCLAAVVSAVSMPASLTVRLSPSAESPAEPPRVRSGLHSLPGSRRDSSAQATALSSRAPACVRGQAIGVRQDTCARREGAIGRSRMVRESVLTARAGSMRPARSRPWRPLFTIMIKIRPGQRSYCGSQP